MCNKFNEVFVVELLAEQVINPSCSKERPVRLVS